MAAERDRRSGVAWPMVRPRVMSRMHWAFFLAAALLAPAAQGATASFSWDDDVFMARDHGYTSGLRLAYVGDDSAKECVAGHGLRCGVTRLVARLPGMQGKPHQAPLLALKQVMMTPRDVRRPDANFNDLPYVGYTSVEAGLFRWDERELTGYGARLGLVGPGSGAGWLQRHAHHLVHDHAPSGWHNQLGQNLTGGVFATWLRRTPERQWGHGRRLVVAYGGTINAGSWESDLRAQVFVRLGRNLAQNVIPDYRSNGNDASLVGLAPGRGSGWEVFFGLEGRYNAYAYTSHHAGPYDVGLRRLTAGAMVGASWSFALGPTVVFLLQHATSPLRKGGSHSFGTVALMWQL